MAKLNIGFTYSKGFLYLLSCKFLRTKLVTFDQQLDAVGLRVTHSLPSIVKQIRIQSQWCILSKYKPYIYIYICFFERQLNINFECQKSKSNKNIIKLTMEVTHSAVVLETRWYVTYTASIGARLCCSEHGNTQEIRSPKLRG